MLTNRFAQVTARYAGIEPDGDAALSRNLLLQSLPEHELERLTVHLETVPLVQRRVLQHDKMPLEFIYFIESGLVSAQAAADKQESVEVWLIGREGAVGSPAILGVRHSPLKYVVHVGGLASRIAVDPLTAILPYLPKLREALLSYLHVGLMQSSQSAACSLRHTAPQRLARWLLTAQDRSERGEIPITQDVLARTLGVRRPTVSEAVAWLQGKGAIAALRGRIRIRDRRLLEGLSCRCYRVLRRQQERPLIVTINPGSLLALQTACCLI